MRGWSSALGEGFDAEIERELKSAAAVVACWTFDAFQGPYVRAEAKKGLARDALAPIFLERCEVPVPFNAIDAADLVGWAGDRTDRTWHRFVERLRSLRERAQTEAKSLARSLSAYTATDETLWPGVLTKLISRTEGFGKTDQGPRYHEDMKTLLQWIESVIQSELADRQGMANAYGGGSGPTLALRRFAEARSPELEELLTTLKSVEGLIISCIQESD